MEAMAFILMKLTMNVNHLSSGRVISRGICTGDASAWIMLVASRGV